MQYFFVLEKHKHRGYHAHGLLNVCEITSESDEILINQAWQQVIKSWQYSAGKVRNQYAMDGFHRNEVTLFDNQRGAINYCLKYMSKDVCDWDYFILS
jgi:hypothetical protein